MKAVLLLATGMALGLIGCASESHEANLVSSSDRPGRDYDMSTDFDHNGLPDWWEIHYMGHRGNDPNFRPDGDGPTLLECYEQGIDPHNYYCQNNFVIQPALTIVEGNNQNKYAADVSSAVKTDDG